MKNSRLPPGLRRRQSQSGQVYYYLKTDPALREVPLGSNLQDAFAVWQQYRIARYTKERPLSGILDIIGCFRVAEIPVRDANSHTILLKQVSALEGHFAELGNPGLRAAVPDARAYLEHRGAKFSLRAGGEVRLLVHIWAWAKRHSLAVGCCPWSTEAVTDNIRADVQREIGDALRYYAHHDADASSDIPHGVAGSPASVREISDYDALAWARSVAKKLQRDGRKDLARAVRKLTAGNLRTLLATPVESGVERGQLVLGTERSAQLAMHQRTRAGRKRQDPTATTRSA